MGKEQTFLGMEEFKKPKVKKNKKVKTQMVIGNQQYVNQVTGEIEEFTVVKKNISADFNFHKIWLEDLLNILNTMGNKKITILSYLLGIMRTSDNTISFTMRSLAEDTQVSLPTVQSTITELIESNVIKRDIRIKSLYTFNPNLLVKGDSKKRAKLLVEYEFEDEKNDNKNKTENLNKLENFKPIENVAGEKVINIDPSEIEKKDIEYQEHKKL